MKTLNMKSRFGVRFWSVLLAVGMFMSVLPETAAAKALFICSDHHRRQFDAWNINPDGTVNKLVTYTSGIHSSDPAGITVDTVDAHSGTIIFMTSEFSAGVEILEVPNVGNPISLGVSAGPSNLAGIDIDDVDDIVYVLRRASNYLFIYDWDSANETLTQLAQIGLPGLSYGYGLALDESRDILWVSDTGNNMVRAYDVDVANWADIAEIPSLSFRISHPPVDVAVDRTRNLVYTVGGWHGSYLLSKYDVAAGTETTINLGHPGCGLAVEEIRGYVYVTGLYPVRKLTGWDCSTTPFTQIQDAGYLPRPAGLAVANELYDPLNLAKNDAVVGYGVYIGQTFTYEITYDNAHNAFDVTNVTLVDTLPLELDYVSSSPAGLYDPVAHTVTSDIGTLPAGDPGGLIELVVRVNQNAVGETTIYNYCTIESDQTPPTTVEGKDPDNPEPGEPGTYILPAIEVAVDIKPQSCPNPLNPKGNGVLPVALLGTEDFDVTQIDPATLELSRDDVDDAVPVLRWAYEDVATPFEGELCDCHTLGADGYLDLTLKFSMAELVEKLKLDEVAGGTIPLTLTGNLLEEFDGTPIRGQDCVWVLKQNGPQE